MNWMNQFDCFLFDFDGLLVNTEHLHFLAYKRLCQVYGIELNWDFRRFCQAAHFRPDGIKFFLYEEFPILYQKEPNWDVLYEEKKRLYQENLSKENLQLMPGVAALLHQLREDDVLRCVVTHSPQEQVEEIKTILPELQSIPHWITRGDYQLPKPAPDSYLYALQKLSLISGKKHLRAIGFEDSWRGLKALQTANIETRVLICSREHPQMKELQSGDAHHFESIEDIFFV